MPKEIIEYLTQYVPLDDEAKCIIAESAMLRHYAQGDLLLGMGAIAQESFLVLHGCVRSYSLHGGKEHTLEFYTERQPILPLSFGTSLPSTHALECLSEVIVCVGTAEKENEMLSRYPCFHEICRTMSDVFANSLQKILVDLKLLSAEERYLLLQRERPELLQRVPQYMVASYLGIEPESLSRIRRRLAKSS